jgi:hypothetical protein
MPLGDIPSSAHPYRGPAVDSETFQPLSAWSKISTAKLLLLTTGFAVLIFLASVGMDGILLREHESRRVVIEMSDAFAGVVAGAIFYLYLNTRRKQVLRRLETISELNHHIRNALQVISSSHYLPDEKKEVEAIDDSVQRIQWALREILPRI